MKHLKLAVAALFAALAFTACDEDEFVPAPSPAPGLQGAYVINQGNFYGGVDGTLDFLGFGENSYVRNVFSSVNGQSLGDSPQDGIVHGSKLYVAMYGSNLLWVLNRETLEIIGQVRVSEPEGIAAAGGYVYVSNNDGYVTRVDTATLAVMGKLPVGPNPAQMTVAGGYLYCSVSDGYNSAAGYANGFRVAKIDLNRFVKEKDIAVGMNPGPIAADSEGNVFVVARGNYGDVTPKVQKITPADQVTDFCAGSNVAARGTTLYVIYNFTDYSSYPFTSELTYSSYDTRTGQVVKQQLLPADHQPAQPIDIDVNPANGDIFIGSDLSAYDYSAPGYVYRYSATGEFMERYGAGIHPCAVVFK